MTASAEPHHTIPALTDDITPCTQSTETFDPVTPELSSTLSLSASQNAVEHLLEEDDERVYEKLDNHRPLLPGVEELTEQEIKADPILSSLARKQSLITPRKTAGHGTVSFGPTRSESMKTPLAGSPFKARPAPTSTRAEGLGPKMTKTAALRAGLKWEENTKQRREKSAEEQDVGNTPGYKRVGLGITVASLAAPSIAPRQTKASQLRLAGAGNEASSSPVKPAITRRDPEIVLAEKKARAAEERERRRKSIVLPTSLSAPSIAPRQNKSSLLRGGNASAAPSSFKSPQPPTPTSATSRTFSSISRTTAALKLTSADNVGERKVPVQQEEDQIKEEKLKRRASVAGVVRSLGAPSITPRLNRAAMLRAPHANKDTASPGSATQSRPRPHSQIITTPLKSTTTPATPSVRSNSSIRAGPSPGPRPTKASLLRAGMGKTKIVI